MQLRALRATAAVVLTALLAPAVLPARADAPASRPSAPSAAGPSTRPALPAVPKSVDDLKAIEQRVEEVTRNVMPAVVGVQAGFGQGSGVIISKDGYVLTAGHVSGEPGRDVFLILADGRRVRGKTLGTNKRIDSGLIKITANDDDGDDWPHVAFGKSGSLVKGQWVLAPGHPGGYQRTRPPVLRLGRVLGNGGSDDWVVTDCTLVGGDSGGPLFDLDGSVVGIHSRIGPSTLINMHTPADAYAEAWDRLAKGEAWGDRFAFLTARGPMLGIGGETVDAGVRMGTVAADGPAAKAGVRPGDVVTAFDNQPVKSIEELAQLISRKRVGDEVEIELLRDGNKVEVTAKLSRRPRE